MQLAQVNIAKIRHGSLDAPEMFPFVTKLAPINTLAERAPGFVWRLTDGDGDGALGIDVFEEDPNVVINLSVWESLPAVHDFTYRTVHAKIMARRAEWFIPVPAIANLAMWWVPDGHRPDVPEAVARMRRLHGDGPTPDAFDFTNPFDETGQPISPPSIRKLCA